MSDKVKESIDKEAKEFLKDNASLCITLIGIWFLVISISYMLGYTSEFTFSTKYNFENASIFLIKNKLLITAFFILYFNHYFILYQGLNKSQNELIKSLLDFTRANKKAIAIIISLISIILALMASIFKSSDLLAISIALMIVSAYFVIIYFQSMWAIFLTILTVYGIYGLGVLDVKYHTHFPRVTITDGTNSDRFILIWKEGNLSYLTECKNLRKVLVYDSNKEIMSYRFNAKLFHGIPCNKKQ